MDQIAGGDDLGLWHAVGRVRSVLVGWPVGAAAAEHQEHCPSGGVEGRQPVEHRLGAGHDCRASGEHRVKRKGARPGAGAVGAEEHQLVAGPEPPYLMVVA